MAGQSLRTDPVGQARPTGMVPALASPGLGTKCARDGSGVPTQGVRDLGIQAVKGVTTKVITSEMEASEDIKAIYENPKL